MNLVAQIPAHAQPDQRVDGCEKGGQRFARSRRRRDQRVVAGSDCRPGLDLRLGRRRISPSEPARYGRMEIVENVQIFISRKYSLRRTRRKNKLKGQIRQRSARYLPAILWACRESFEDNLYPRRSPCPKRVLHAIARVSVVPITYLYVKFKASRTLTDPGASTHILPG